MNIEIATLTEPQADELYQEVRADVSNRNKTARSHERMRVGMTLGFSAHNPQPLVPRHCTGEIYADLVNVKTALAIVRGNYDRAIDHPSARCFSSDPEQQQLLEAATNRRRQILEAK